MGINEKNFIAILEFEFIIDKEYYSEDTFG